ncbi:ubiquitin-conjugating enzyme/RWD-like protein [Plectosphaerella cucumerina]|uniref:Ubiquitin-conjugating enzyme/RWD-like protein n=1 Tax=Plectosphaerella cucumerina TaxID=40658 RepID=A0A8K0T5U7_9PEZI|nr:ubiquitin-conjugating enzyme/RWD-like protein [Plectosphaerella cucumerina]
MTNPRLSSMPSLRRQHLLAEFSGLKQACPEGIFLSLTPGDPTLWAGVMFIRKGPYENVILRFQISFPDSYPQLPPLVTFSTDLFHPLIAPLTTYMYTTDIQDNGTVSATDDERLPPGGYSLRHGFPGWFGRRSRAPGSSQQPRVPATPAKGGISSVTQTPDSKATAASMTPGAGQSSLTSSVSTYEVLRYIRSTFDDEEVIDSLPLEAAGNPGAWYAWKTRQRMLGKGPAAKEAEKPEEAAPAEGEVKEVQEPAAEEAKPKSPGVPTTPPVAARDPAEWNWEGVWETRVKKGIATSMSESILYGGTAAGEELIHFLPMEEGDITTAKENLLRTLGSTV